MLVELQEKKKKKKKRKSEKAKKRKRPHKQKRTEQQVDHIQANQQQYQQELVCTQIYRTVSK